MAWHGQKFQEVIDKLIFILLTRCPAFLVAWKSEDNVWLACRKMLKNSSIRYWPAIGDVNLYLFWQFSAGKLQGPSYWKPKIFWDLCHRTFNWLSAQMILQAGNPDGFITVVVDIIISLPLGNSNQKRNLFEGMKNDFSRCHIRDGVSRVFTEF